MRQLLPPSTSRIGLHVSNNHLNVKLHFCYAALHISTISVFTDLNCGETRQPFRRWIFGIWKSSYSTIDDPLDLSWCRGEGGGDNPVFLVLSNANFTHYCENRRDTTDISEATDELTFLSTAILWRRIVVGMWVVWTGTYRRCLTTNDCQIYASCVLLLLWRYNSAKVLAFSTISFHLRRSRTCPVHFIIFIFFKPFLTSSSHRHLGLPTGLLVNGFHLYNFFTIPVSAFYLCVQTNSIFGL
jgi:hypothetical protein